MKIVSWTGVYEQGRSDAARAVELFYDLVEEYTLVRLIMTGNIEESGIYVYLHKQSESQTISLAVSLAV